MLRLLVWLLLAYVGYRIVKALVGAKPSGSAPQQVRTGEETVQDPVCGVYLTKADAVVGRLEGVRHYFCSMDCLEKFQEQVDHTDHQTMKSEVER